MKKKLTAVMLSMALTLSLAACGSDTTKKDGEVTPTAAGTPTTEVTEEVTPTTKPEDANPTEAPKPTEAPEEKTEPDYSDLKKVGFSVESGIYAEEFVLELKSEENAEIYYTTDGSDPSTSATAVLYREAIRIGSRKGDKNVVTAVDPNLFCTANTEYNRTTGKLNCKFTAPSDSAVDKCTVIRAVCKNKAGEYSAVTTGTYFIGTTEEHIEGIRKSCEAMGTDLAVISLTMNFDDLFDDAKGIYVTGDVFAKSFEEFKKKNKYFQGDDTRKLPANYSQRGREWEREAHIDFFEMNASGAVRVLDQNCGIRIQGNYSRSDLQKGFRLYARKDYDWDNKKFEYPVFGEVYCGADGESLEEFKTLVLRAGGNCAFTSKFNDTFWQQLCRDTACATKASRPCVVYLNGEYWGLYVLEEDYSDDYFADHFGVDKDEVAIYKGDAETYASGYKLDEGTVPEGAGEDYFLKELKGFFVTHDSAASQADYEALTALVDPESVMDYFAIQVWINNKWDWPGKNWLMWRTASVDSANPYADGRFRFGLFDMDFGGVSGGGEAGANTLKDANYKPNGLLDKNTGNVAVLCFAYLMTNADFRKAYLERLEGLTGGVFEKEHAKQVLKGFDDAYGPLFEQFFRRYPGSGDARSALNGGYGTSACIRDFIERRGGNIPRICQWAENH